MSVNDQIQQYRYYQWDTFGKAVGMTIKQKASDGTWKTSVYYFLTNQRGDVSSIIDNTGVEVGSYSYDAYGNVLSETGTIAKENNIRYASYYYDQETKHYYLKARYYDPVNGIFQALDPHPGDEDDIISQNGYNYAGNNPIINIDPDGDFYWMAAGALIGGVSSYVTAKKSGTKGWKLWGSVAGGTALGAIGGVGSGTFRALKVARSVSTATKGSHLTKGRAAHNAWDKSMKKVVPGGKYNKTLRGTKKRPDAQFLNGRVVLELKSKYTRSSTYKKQLNNYKKAGAKVRIVLRY
ncbi:RHS repeat-associated core domain-containing protein [Niallia sp. JL1B1071]|uniref:RHS repeat-associated core domain-containing protein n=1 Tax=Niallia tiangongensis TaxID=3237105 RepID=UPI0037DCDC6E